MKEKQFRRRLRRSEDLLAHVQRGILVLAGGIPVAGASKNQDPSLRSGGQESFSG
jgi:hypothetical protein